MDAARGPLPAAYHGAAGYPRGNVAAGDAARDGLAQIRAVAPERLGHPRYLDRVVLRSGAYRDPGFLAGVDAFLPSDKEVEALWGLDDLLGVMRHLASSGPAIVAVKRGERGSLLSTTARSDCFWEIPVVAG